MVRTIKEARIAPALHQSPPSILEPAITSLVLRAGPIDKASFPNSEHTIFISFLEKNYIISVQWNITRETLFNQMLRDIPRIISQLPYSCARSYWELLSILSRRKFREKKTVMRLTVVSSILNIIDQTPKSNPISDCFLGVSTSNACTSAMGRKDN